MQVTMLVAQGCRDEPDTVSRQVGQGFNKTVTMKKVFLGNSLAIQ